MWCFRPLYFGASYAQLRYSGPAVTVVSCAYTRTRGSLILTILGAGGAIGNELVKLLATKNQPFRLVGRNPKATPGATETLAADVTDRDQTVQAVAGSSVV